MKKNAHRFLTKFGILLVIHRALGMELAAAPNGVENTRANTAATNVALLREYLRQKRADIDWDWKQPINFWGKVIDQSNAPVAGANVRLSWNDLSANGTSEFSMSTDGNGLFSLEGRHGKVLCVG